MLCNNQQQLQWAAYVVLWVANTYPTLKHRSYYLARLLHTELYVLLQEASDYVGAYQIKHAHNF